MADYLARSTQRDKRADLEDYLSAPAEEREQKLSDLWDKYGHFIINTKLR